MKQFRIVTIVIIAVALVAAISPLFAQQQQERRQEQQQQQQREQMQQQVMEPGMQRTFGCLSLMRMMAHGMDVEQAREQMGEEALQQCLYAQEMANPSPAAWLLTMREQLGLDQEQVRELTQKDSEFRRDHIESRQELRQQMVDLNTELRRPVIDKGKLEGALDDVASAENDVMNSWFEGREAAIDELTEGQKQQVERMTRQRLEEAIAMGEQAQQQ